MTLISRMGMFATALAFSATLGIQALPVHAAGLSGGLDSAAEGTGLKTSNTDIPSIIGNIIGALISFVGVLLLLYLIYGGFLYMTASDKGGVEKALSVIKNAVIGIIIIASSYAIASYVITQIEGAVSQKGASTSESNQPKGP
jgi:hypothetical protein